MGAAPSLSVLSWLGNLPMKRYIFRMSALAGVVVLGLIAIAYAQRGSDWSESTTSDGQANPLRAAAQPAARIDAPAAPIERITQTETHAPSLSPPPTNPIRQASHNETETPAAAPPADLFGLQPAVAQTPPAAPSDDAFAAGPDEPATLELGGPERPLREELAEPSFAASASAPAPRPAPPEEIAMPAAPAAPMASASPQFSSGPMPSFSDTAAVMPSHAPALASSAEAEQAMPIGSAATEGTGRPSSDKQLDGPQSPQLSIQKFAPEEIQVGKPAVFRVEVQNIGTIAAEDVEIRDEVPKGTSLVGTNPQASVGARGELVWSLGKLEPGRAVTVEAEVMPSAEGEIGSVATVHFSAPASARTISTRPQLAVETSAPNQILIDNEVTLTITISNPGTGVARGVTIEERVPSGMKHPAGGELEYEVGDLAPGQSQTLELTLAAVQAGAMTNTLTARADGVAPVTRELPIQVIAPELALAIAGPTSRYLERQATHELSVSNPGTAPAKEVRLVAQLPPGLKFVNANNNAHYDEQTRTVHWALAELPVGETGTVELTTLPVEMGQHTVALRGTADRAPMVKEEQQVVIDGIAAIRFQVVDVDDPIEVGGETTYEIRVLNQGSKDATRVRLVAELSDGLQPVAAEGPDSLRHAVQGNQIVFEPLERLSPKVDTTYRVRVAGRAPGDHRIRVLLQTDEMQSPVTKEESTRVFSDK